MHARAGPGKRARVVEGALAALLFTLALVLRLIDPLSSPIIGAEDPYTHMVYVKELVSEGSAGRADALNIGAYPPGLHALLAIVWVLSDAPLHDLARFGPPVLGAVAVLAVAALVREAWGLTAGLAAGVLAATMPEHVFRTVLLFPTVLDLVLMPLVLLFTVRLARGHRADAVALAVVGAALAVTHPWAILLMAPALGAFLLLRLVFPAAGDARPDAAGALAGLGTVLALVAFTLVRFKDTPLLGRVRPRELPALVADASPLMLLVAVGALTVGVALVGLGVSRARSPPPRARPWLRYPIAVVAGLAVLVLVFLRAPSDLPPMVEYPRMLGTPLILLGAAGVAVGLARRNAAAEALAAFTLVVLPLTAFPLVHPTVVPHRSVVYLGLALTAFGGLAVGAAVDAAARLAGARANAPPRPVARVTRSAAALLGVAVLLAVTVPAAADSYRWYRYYSEDEYVVVDAALDALAADPDAVILAGAWQPNLFLRALGDADRVQWAPHAFTDAEERNARVQSLSANGAHVYLLADHHAVEQRGVEWVPGSGPFPEHSDDVVRACCDGRSALYRLS